MGLVKNSYVGRTFIQPSQTIRQLGIRLKLNPLRDVVRGKRLVVVDDSIVRGNTQRALVRMLREAGALEVHVRISSPPVMWPCFYGIDFASRAELIASGMGVEEIRSSIGADTLAYVSLEGLTGASNQPADRLCRACFDGSYPIEIPQRDLIGKHVLEGLAKNARAAVPDSQLAAHGADHEHIETGQVVVHNGIAPVDRMDALLTEDDDGRMVVRAAGGGAEDALTRP
jgi:amidophosphoribosyltransferase